MQGRGEVQRFYSGVESVVKDWRHYYQHDPYPESTEEGEEQVNESLLELIDDAMLLTDWQAFAALVSIADSLENECDPTVEDWLRHDKTVSNKLKGVGHNRSCCCWCYAHWPVPYAMAKTVSISLRSCFHVLFSGERFRVPCNKVWFNVCRGVCIISGSLDSNERR